MREAEEVARDALAAIRCGCNCPTCVAAAADVIRARDAEVRAVTLEQYEHALTEETDTHHRTTRVPCDCEHPERHRRLAGDDTPPTHAALEPVRVRRYVTPWEPDPRTPEQTSPDPTRGLQAVIDDRWPAALDGDVAAIKDVLRAITHTATAHGLTAPTSPDTDQESTP